MPKKSAAAPSVDDHIVPAHNDKPEKSVTTAATLSFPTNLYLPDALVLSNQHSKPQHSRFPPATLPNRRTLSPAFQDDRKTTAMVSTTKAPVPFPPRRRMTFQPFRKTTTATPSLDKTISTDPAASGQRLSPVPPHYAASDELDAVKRKEPEVRPIPDTTKNLLISTEPSVNTELKFPEVPLEQDDDPSAEETHFVLPGESNVGKNEQAAPPVSVDTTFSNGSTSSSIDEVKKAPSSLDKSTSNVPAPATAAVDAKPFHDGLDKEVAPAVVAGETSVGDAAVPSKVTPTTTEEDSAVPKPAQDFTSTSDEGSLGLPGSISDQQSALEILEQLHKAEEAPVEEPSALADPPADDDGQPSFNIDDMMVSLAMGESEGSDSGSDQAPSAPQAPAHLTDMEGRMIY
nr:fibrous sheath CABYR-binding protein-like [Rhipicephalus microplus]